MKRSRSSDDQIIGILKKHVAGLPAAELCREHGISDATFYHWCEEQGSMEVSENHRRIAIQVFSQRYR